MSRTEPLLAKAIAGVIRNAEDGELPLFACTLGLPLAALQEALNHCLPEQAPSQHLPDEHYQLVMQSRPALHADLVRLLLHGRSPQANPQHAAWLAHGIAAAATGSRHLWEDLGMAGRDDVSHLLQQYFEPLFLRNTTNLKWKRFLFDELGSHAPDCARCDNYSACYPPAHAH